MSTVFIHYNYLVLSGVWLGPGYFSPFMEPCFFILVLWISGECNIQSSLEKQSFFRTILHARAHTNRGEWLDFRYFSIAMSAYSSVVGQLKACCRPDCPYTFAVDGKLDFDLVVWFFFFVFLIFAHILKNIPILFLKWINNWYELSIIFCVFILLGFCVKISVQFKI